MPLPPPRHDRRRLIVAAAALVALVLGSFLVVGRLLKPAGAGAGHATSTSTSTTIQPVPSTTLGVLGAIKPVLQGLIARGGIPPADFRRQIPNFVVNVGWKDLQPAYGAQITENNPIDQAIAVVRQQNAAEPTLNLRLKVRLFAGILAPDWLKVLGGSPITVTDPLGGRSGTIGRFWTPEFGEAYADLQRRLAARYDGVPEIAEVTISRCTTVYAEPFIRQAGDIATARALLTAGFTTEADQRCQREQIDAHAVWLQTRSGLAFSPYQRINPGGTWTGDEAFTDSMMRYCRGRLGDRCVLENNSLRFPPLKGSYNQMYALMKALGPPISFQTATIQRVGDLSQTLALAARLGANAVELPAGFQSLGVGGLDKAGALLAKNPS